MARAPVEDVARAARRRRGRWRPRSRRVPSWARPWRPGRCSAPDRVAGRCARRSRIRAPHARAAGPLRRADDVELAEPGAVAFGPLPRAPARCESASLDGGGGGLPARRGCARRALRRPPARLRTRPRARPPGASRSWSAISSRTSGPARRRSRCGARPRRCSRRRPSPTPGADEIDVARSLRRPSARCASRVDPRLLGARERRPPVREGPPHGARARADRGAAGRDAGAAAAGACARGGRARRAERRGSGRPPGRPARRRAPPTRAGPRRYLTAAALTMLVGRGARENHQPHLPGRAARGPVAARARRAGRARDPARPRGPRRRRGPARGGGGGGVLQRAPARRRRWTCTSTRRKHVQPPGGGARPRARRALGDRARRAARSRGPAARGAERGRSPQWRAL